MKQRLIFFAALAVSGCAHLSDDGARVVIVTDSGSLSGCEHVGGVKSGSGWGGTAMSGAGKSQATEKLRNKTAKIGGTHLVVSGSFSGATGTTVEGEAYRCPLDYKPGQAAPVGCGKDADCKGDRICTNGKCIDRGGY